MSPETRIATNARCIEKYRAKILEKTGEASWEVHLAFKALIAAKKAAKAAVRKPRIKKQQETNAPPIDLKREYINLVAISRLCDADEWAAICHECD